MLRFLLALFVLLPCSALADKAPYTAENAVIRETPMKVAAGYVTLLNPTEHADKLLRVSARWAERVELHNVTASKEGVMQMIRVKSIDVPAGGRLELRPGSYHLMIFGPKEKLKPGELRKMTLHFQSNTSLKVKFVVQPLSYRDQQAKNDSAADHETMDHSHHMHH